MKDLQTQVTEALKEAINAGLDGKSTKGELVQSLHDVTAKIITDYVNDSVGTKVINIRGFAPRNQASSNFIGGAEIDDGLSATITNLMEVHAALEELAEKVTQPRIMVTFKKIDIHIRAVVPAILKATGEFMSSLADAITFNAKKEVEELAQSGGGSLKKGGFLETFFGEMAIAKMQSEALDKAPIEKFNKALDELIKPIEKGAEGLITAGKAAEKASQEQVHR